MADARLKMIESAARLQQLHGVSGTSFAAILADSGASRGAIYHHFPGGRDELAALATEHAAALLAGELDELLVAGDPASALERFVRGASRLALEHDYATGCSLTAGALDDAEAAAARRAAAAGFARLEAILTEALAGRGAEEAQRIAVTSIAAIGGALVLVRAERSLRPLERVAAGLQALLEVEPSPGDGGAHVR